MRVYVHDVTGRDGVQSYDFVVSTRSKLIFARDLAAAGVASMEPGSFVSSKSGLYPKFLDNSDVLKGLDDVEIPKYWLAPSFGCCKKGVAAGAKSFGLVVSVNEEHERKNKGNASLDDGIRESREIIKAAAKDGHTLRHYFSTFFDYEHDGDTPPEQAREVVRRVLEDADSYTGRSPVVELVVGDTFGRADVGKLERIKALREIPNLPPIALHLHPQHYNWRDIVYPAVREFGIQHIHGSVTGGGCPTDPHGDNPSILELVKDLESNGFDTGINLELLYRADAYWRGVVDQGCRVNLITS